MYFNKTNTSVPCLKPSLCLILFNAWKLFRNAFIFVLV